jgi:hypothetical protein
VFDDGFHIGLCPFVAEARYGNKATVPKIAIQDCLFLSMEILQNNHHTIIVSY